jgi:hypothetical protein
MNSVASYMFRPPVVAIFRQVGGCNLYNTTNLRICYALIVFLIMNHQCLGMKHFNFSHKTLKFFL